MCSSSALERQAVRIIARFFCRYVKPMALRAVATRFLSKGPGLARNLREDAYQVLCERLRDPKVMDASRDMLHRILGLANWRRGRCPLVTGSVTVKIFLAAYLIQCRYLAWTCMRIRPSSQVFCECIKVADLTLLISSK